MSAPWTTVKAGIVCLVFGALHAGLASAHDEQNGLKNPENVERASDAQMALLDDVLWWLPADTETIEVSQGPFPVDWWTSAAAEKPPRNPINATNHLRPHLRGEFPDDANADLLRGREIALFVGGSRHFDLPDEKLPGADGIASLYEGCQILVFTDLAGAGDTLMAVLREKADEVEGLAGQKVARFDPDAKRFFWTRFFVQPRPNVLLIATDHDYLAEVLARMTKRAERRAIPEDSPEWKHFDRRAPEWAVRHFNRAPKRDPTSPFKKEMPQFDSKAIGFVYAARAGDTARVLYLSDARDPIAIAKRFWGASHFGTDLDFRRPAPGVVEIDYPLRSRQALSNFSYGLTIVLGKFLAF